MGHAGAVVNGKGGSARDKIAALKELGVSVAPISDQIGDTLIEVLKEHDLLEKCMVK